MSLEQNLKSINQRLKAAAEAAHRNSSEIQLLAVSKKQPLQKIKQAHALGIKNFGENYVQEAREKMSELNFPEICWHFIGHLQTNKVKDVVGHFEYIHSVDRSSLLQKINNVALEKGIRQKIFLQVNLAGEASKSGVSEGVLESLFNEGVQLEGLQICGLMIMPPFADDAESSRRYFAKGKKLLQLLRKNHDPNSQNQSELSELSMGTSQDFEVAIQEGATWIRLGSTLLGERVNQ